MRVTGERLSRVPLGKETTSARQRFLSEHPQEEPKGVRAWNCRITAASIPGIEIANEVHPSGTQ